MHKAVPWSLALLSALLVGMITVILSFPFLRMDAPSGAHVAVVEGWIDQAYLPKVKELITAGGYDTIYITGTPRNFSYTMRIGDTVIVELKRPAKGAFVVNTCGALHAGLLVWSDAGPLLADSVFGPCKERYATIDPPATRLLFTPTHGGRPDPRWELAFILYARINGINLHALQRSVRIHRSSGAVGTGTPSFADATADALIDLGIPASRIKRLPTVLSGDSRTWANAQRFAAEAHEHGIIRVDVISFGIHARRSRLAYSKACGDKVIVGVRGIEDPELEHGRWWHSLNGWRKVIRELIGVPASYLVEPVR